MKDILLNAQNWQSRDWESCNFLTQCSLVRPVLAGTSVNGFKYRNNCFDNVPLSSAPAFFQGRLFAVCWRGLKEYPAPGQFSANFINLMRLLCNCDCYYCYDCYVYPFCMMIQANNAPCKRRSFHVPNLFPSIKYMKRSTFESSK